MNKLSPQTPADKITNSMSFANLLAVGDTIASATVDSSMAGLVIDQIVHDTVSVTFRVTGGAANATATITAHVTTAQGNILNRSVAMDILPTIS